MQERLDEAMDLLIRLRLKTEELEMALTERSAKLKAIREKYARAKAAPSTSW
jgi:hypothetical protein